MDCLKPTTDRSLSNSSQFLSTMSVTICGNFNIAAKNVFTSINTTTTSKSRHRQRAAARPINPNQNPRRNPQRTARQNLGCRRRRNQRRLALPSLHADPRFWAKIRHLPNKLRQYLTPDWHLPSTTCYDLRRLIWHFDPSKHIPCKMTKAQLLDLFEDYVAHPYGAYYGI